MTHMQAGCCSRLFSLPPETVEKDSSVLVKVIHSSESQLCPYPESVEELRIGDVVVTSTRYGNDLGRVLGSVFPDNVDVWKERGTIFRVADEKDVERYTDNEAAEQSAFAACQERIASHDLPMKLVSAHYVLEEPKLLFFFTADSRVDFRELVRDLVSHFKMRIELRQIGVRDDARVLGGLGVCGRVLCCNGITDKLKPVSIKMAKVQSLSLNSTKISGPCGRLLCCLAYEYDYYADEKGKVPGEGARIEYDGSGCRVCEVNLISQKIRMVAEDGRTITVPAERFVYDSGSSRWKVSE
jgi:cell fate regulator YaaT (PSP1 superfamily)